MLQLKEIRQLPLIVAAAIEGNGREIAAVRDVGAEVIDRLGLAVGRGECDLHAVGYTLYGLAIPRFRRSVRLDLSELDTRDRFPGPRQKRVKDRQRAATLRICWLEPEAIVQAQMRS